MSVNRSVFEQLKHILSFSVAELILIAAIFITMALIFVALIIFNDDLVVSYILQMQQQPGSFNDKYLLVYQMVNNNQYLADASVFVFWMIVGLSIYLTFCVLAVFERSFFRFFTIFVFVKMDKALVVEEALLQLLVRSASIAGLLVGGIYFMKYLYPYLLVSLDVYSYDTVSSALWSTLTLIIGITVIVHIFAVLLRGATLRERLFSSYE